MPGDFSFLGNDDKALIAEAFYSGPQSHLKHTAVMDALDALLDPSISARWVLVEPGATNLSITDATSANIFVRCDGAATTIDINSAALPSTGSRLLVLLNDTASVTITVNDPSAQSIEDVPPDQVLAVFLTSAGAFKAWLVPQTAGALAALSLVGAAQLSPGAISDLTALGSAPDNADLLAIYRDAAGALRSVTVGDLISLAGGGGGFSTVDDANTAITIGDSITNTHRRLTASTAITLTLDAQATVGTKVAVTPKGAGAVTAQVEAGATYELPLDASAARTASFGVTGYVLFECVANADTNSAVWDVVGETDHSDIADNAIDMNGEQITNAVMPLADDEETASFTFALTHAQQKMVRCNHATVAITATIPTNAAVAFPIGTVINLNQWGAAAVTVAPDTGVTMNLPSDKTGVLRAQYSVAGLWKQATDTWLLFGDLTDAA